MRYILSAAVAVLTMALMPVSAHASKWECQGPAASCVSGKTTVYKTKTVSKAKYGKVAKAKSNKVAYKSSKSKKSYSGGGGGYSGMASYYWQPQALASGGRFNPNALTAAHKTLPFGTKVLVTNRNNGKSVVVTINDRGPYIKGRIIDLSKRAAQVVGMTGSGVAPVSVQVLGRG